METEKLDNLVKDYKLKRAEYQKLSQESKEAHAKMKNAESMVLQALNDCDKKKYFVDGIGTVTKVEKMSVPTPKTMEQKKEFFEYLNKEGGEDLQYAYMSVNSMALNKFYNEQKEEKGLLHEIPGLEMPILMEQLRFKGN